MSGEIADPKAPRHRSSLNNILGSLGLGIGLPPLLEAPRIVGSRSTTQYRLQSFQFGCSIRAGAPGDVIPVPCTVTVRPVETLRLALGQSYNCSYTETPASGIGGGLTLKTCMPTGLLAGQGFTFQTTPDILNTSSLGSLKGLVDTGLELLVVSVFDNYTYREYCL
ncbi:bud emergence protein 1 [Pestalotiopsis sp. IQ-011]